MSLTSQETEAQDPTFVAKVKASAANAAIAIASEADNTPGHEQRVDYGTLFLRTPEAEAPKLALGVAGQIANPLAASDSAINNAVSAIWNAYAGIS